ncbi:hypothetical protein LAZ67_8003298 [Cordylochernes scorpioides]|uniref:Uncharacterized protein n=1 Tax=Cordylochernes scorpioides TaxID=51811 RepID=A0ABY6KS16_9ARAC|nr:hypothetical protein LAZ67_8003298 [Cordylochernes scorpioides]
MATTLFLIAPCHQNFIFTLRRFNLRRIFLERNPDAKRDYIRTKQMNKANCSITDFRQRKISSTRLDDWVQFRNLIVEFHCTEWKSLRCLHASPSQQQQYLLSWVCKAAALGLCQFSVVVVSNEEPQMSPCISITAVAMSTILAAALDLCHFFARLRPLLGMRICG